MNTYVGQHPFVFLFLAVLIIVPGLHFLGRELIALPYLDVSMRLGVVMAFTPAILALLMAFLEKGRAGVKSLFGSLLPRTWTGLAWCGVSMIIMPVAVLLSCILILLMNGELPSPTPVVLALAYFAPLFLLAIGEELGWTGYATEPLLRRWGALNASLIVGAACVLVHLLAYAEAGRSTIWIAAQSVGILCRRVIIVWLFVNSRKLVLPAVLLHATYNVSYRMWPGGGAHYDPVVLGGILVPAAAIIIYLSGPTTFRHYRFARSKNHL